MTADELGQEAEATASWKRIDERNSRGNTDAWETVDPASLGENEHQEQKLDKTRVHTSILFWSRPMALTNTVTCKIAFKSTLPAAYSAKLRTAGMGTTAPRAKATVSVIVLSRIDGPIFASVLATRSSTER